MRDLSEPTPEVVLRRKRSPEPNQEAQPEGCSAPPGKKCCASKADCARGEYCALNGLCYADDSCVHPDRLTCAVLGEICKPDGKCGDCKTDAECGTDAKCSLQGLCFHYPCVKDADCPTKTVCQNFGLGMRCVVPLKTNTSGYVVGWQDDSFAKDCMDYRYPPTGYAAATQDGVYQILDKPDEKHWVSCNMTYAGGGWTLTMKIQKNGSTFGYGSPLWDNGTTVGATANPTDVVLDGNDAKLLSYSHVKVKQIMLQMQQDPDVSPITPANGIEQRRAILTLSAQENSLENAIKGAKALATAGGLERQNWRAMAYNASAFPNVCKEGLKIEQAFGQKKIGVRIGVITTSATAPCTGDPAWIGVGGQYLDANNVEQPLGAGSWQKAGLLRQSSAYAYVWVRAFPVATQTVSQQTINGQTARAYSSTSFAKSCLEYRMPPSVSEASGDYWLTDGTSPNPYRAYCNMARHGGGWTLALKAKGNEQTLAFNPSPSSAWQSGILSQNMNQGHNPSLEGSFSLKSYTLLAPQQIMIEQAILQSVGPDAATSINSTITSLVVHLTNPNDAPLAKVFAATNPAAIRFAYPLGAMAWMEWFPSPIAKLHTGCVAEGFSIEQCRGVCILYHLNQRITFFFDK
jgi:hypothetical protein